MTNNTPRAVRRVVLAVLSTAALLALPLASPAVALPDHADAIDVYARDVYVVVGSTLRNPTAATDPSAPLFTDAGIALERTWGQWSGAAASSRVSVIGGPNQPRTDVRLTLGGLVPGGLYSAFWGTLGPDSEQPLCPNVERTLPLDVFPTASGPTLNSFHADAAGSADFRGRVDGDLLSATQVFFTVVYHFFGEAPYPFPNLGEFLTQGDTCRSSFGSDSMRHLVILQQW